MANGWPILKVEYADTITTFLQRFNKKLADSVPALLEAMGKRLRYRFKVNIRDGVDGRGHRFAPLKRRRGKGHNKAMRPLYDRGDLFEFLDFQLVSATAAEVGDPTPYGIFQNRGTKSIPARPFISFDDSPTGDLPESMFYDFAQHQFYESDYYQGQGPGEVGGF